MTRSIHLWIFFCFFVLTCTNSVIVNAMSGKDDKEREANDDNDDDDVKDFETDVPTSAPFKVGGNDSKNNVLAPISFNVENPTAPNTPVMAPVAQTNTDTTEDMDEDDEETILMNEMKEVCRSISRGIAVTTNTSIQIVYQFDILTTTATPLYTGIAVNNAVANHLTDKYIKPHCNTNNSNATNNKLVRRRARSLQSSSSFEYGDVRGVARGTTTVITDDTCFVPVEDTGIVACHKLQTINTIYFRNDFIPLDDDGFPIIDDIEDEILMDISAAFDDNTIEKNVIKGGETGLQGSSYTSGTVGEVSVQGEQVDRSAESSNNESRGLTRAGKAFLTLFLLCLIGVICYFVYKYGYPMCKEQYPKLQDRMKQRQERKISATAASNTERSFQVENTNALMTLFERFQRKIPNEINRPYDFIPSDRGNDRKVLISDTMISSSTDGYGTEMILEDLQDEEVRLSPTNTTSTPTSNDYRFTPSTLPNTKELERKKGRQLTFENVDTVTSNSDENENNFGTSDTFSFSDVNIVIDDSSSYASTVPPLHRNMSQQQNVFHPTPNNIPMRRPYSVPDTVNL